MDDKAYRNVFPLTNVDVDETEVGSERYDETERTQRAGSRDRYDGIRRSEKYKRRKWRFLTFNARRECNMAMTMKRLLGVMVALKKGVVLYAGVEANHIHIIYRGFYMHQRSWSEIFKICSHGSYITWVEAVNDQEHFNNVVAYIGKQASIEKFINWGVSLTQERLI